MLFSTEFPEPGTSNGDAVKQWKKDKQTETEAVKTIDSCWVMTDRTVHMEVLMNHISHSSLPLEVKIYAWTKTQGEEQKYTDVYVERQKL